MESKRELRYFAHIARQLDSMPFINWPHFKWIETKRKKQTNIVDRLKRREKTLFMSKRRRWNWQWKILAREKNEDARNNLRYK